MRDLLGRMGGVQFLGVPFGQAGLFLVSMGIGGLGIGLLQRFRVPPVFAGVALSALVKRGFVQNFLGQGPTDVLSTALVVEGADIQFDAVDRLVGLASGLVPLGQIASYSGPQLGAGDAGALGQADVGVYLTDVERKVQSIMQAQG